jgi:glycosyltransferase involved in cell wall biosynthesis
MGLQNILFLEQRPVAEADAVLRLADVLLVHLKDHPLFRITIPSKTQASLALGRPILMGVKGDAADLVVKAKAGLLCEPENAHSIAAAVKTFLAMTEEDRKRMGENGRKFYESELSIEVGAKHFMGIFESVLQKKHSRHNVA